MRITATRRRRAQGSADTPSAEVLDDADELGSLVAVVSGEGDEVSGAGDDGALLGVGGDGVPASAAEFDEALAANSSNGRLVQPPPQSHTR